MWAVAWCLQCQTAHGQGALVTQCPGLTPAGSSALRSPRSLPRPEQGEPHKKGTSQPGVREANSGNKQICNTSTIIIGVNREGEWRQTSDTVADCPLANGCSASPQAEISPSPPTPPVYVLSRTFWGLEYPCGQFRSALLALLPPSSLCSCSLAEYRKLKSPWLGVTSWQQLKHQRVTNIVLLQNPKHSTRPPTRKKINSLPAQTRTSREESRQPL